MSREDQEKHHRRVLMFEHTCRECKKKYENEYPAHSICPECWEAFNTPEVQKAREEYQQLEAEWHKKMQDGIISIDEFKEMRSHGFKKGS